MPRPDERTAAAAHRAPDQLGEHIRYRMPQAPTERGPLPVLTLLDATYSETWIWTGFQPSDALDLQASLNAAVQSAQQ